MSTNDVPGSNPINNDVLAGGCWAEHDDGSLLYVQAVEGGAVIYELFDLSEDRPVEYRDRMTRKLFDKQFSWKKGQSKSDKWTWHDKTSFPWDRILKNFREGVKPVSADALIDDAEAVKKTREKHRNSSTGRFEKFGPDDDDAGDEDDEEGLSDLIEAIVERSIARRIAQERALKAHRLRHADVSHRVDEEVPKESVATRMRRRLQSAINGLRTGK